MKFECSVAFAATAGTGSIAAAARLLGVGPIRSGGPRHSRIDDRPGDHRAIVQPLRINARQPRHLRVVNRRLIEGIPTFSR